MKQKFKNPAALQEKGFDFHTKLLKKTVKALQSASEKTAINFFYNSEFDFGAEKHPVLYVGDFTADWKKYIKENKTEKTFAAGLLKVDNIGNLMLQIKIGKGAKEIVLKSINKQLLRPFSKAYFVESVEGSENQIHSTVNDNDSENDTGDQSIRLINAANKVIQSFKSLRIDFNENNANSITGDIKTIVGGFKSFKDQNQELKDKMDLIQKIYKSVAQMIKIDRNMESVIQEINKQILKYNDMVDHSTEKAVQLAKEITIKLDALKKDAEVLKDNELIKVVDEFKTLLK